MNKILIRVKVLPATDTRGQRIKITRSIDKASRTVAYSFQFNEAVEQVEELFKLFEIRNYCYGYNYSNKEFIILVDFSEKEKLDKFFKIK